MFSLDFRGAFNTIFWVIAALFLFYYLLKPIGDNVFGKKA